MKPTIKISGDLRQILGRKFHDISRIGHMAKLVADSWREAVRSSSLSAKARDRYSRAIQPMRSRPGAIVTDLVSILLETGWSRFDMKPGLLKNAARAVVPIVKQGSTVFRSVSQKSPSGSWVHPGFRGANVVSSVKAKVDKMIAEALKNG